MCAEGATLAAVMAAGVTFRSDAKYVAFRALVAAMGGRIAPLPDDSFKESGTGVRTVLLTTPVSREALRASSLCVQKSTAGPQNQALFA